MSKKMCRNNLLFVIIKFIFISLIPLENQKTLKKTV